MTAGEAHELMSALPFAHWRTILGGADPLVFAPHADDESLGCGGLLALCAAEGGSPAVLVLTDGTGSHPRSLRYPPERLLALREREARGAVDRLGVAPDRVTFLRVPDTAAPTEGDGFEAAVMATAAWLRRWGCGVLLAPWRHDPHGDHWAAHLMAAEVARRTGVVHLAYPVWGWTLPDETALSGPAPAGFRLDVRVVLPAKREAIAAHRSQYAGLIDDDPAGFQMAPVFIDRFTGPYETFLTSP